MGRYTGPKGRVNRRLATLVYESTGSIRALERRETPPGMYGRRKKMSTYGAGFAEKQAGLFDDEPSVLRTIDRVAEESGAGSYRDLLREIDRAFDAFDRRSFRFRRSAPLCRNVRPQHRRSAAEHRRIQDAALHSVCSGKGSVDGGRP